MLNLKLHATPPLIRMGAMRTIAVVAVTVAVCLYFTHSGPPPIEAEATGVHVMLPPPEGVIWPSRYAEVYAIDVGLAVDIIDTALAHDVPVSIAFALVATESSFNPNAVSSAGAIGLTQILPSTARGLEPRITRERLFDVGTNLDLGFRYLRQMLDRYNNLPRALAAYNMGPTRLDQLAVGHGGTYSYVERIRDNEYGPMGD